MTYFNSIWYDYKQVRKDRYDRAVEISIPYGTIISDEDDVIDVSIAYFNSIWYDYKHEGEGLGTRRKDISIPYGTIIRGMMLVIYSGKLLFQFHMVRL